MAEQKSATHILIIEDDKGRKEFALKDSVYFIGKSPDCHLQLLSPFVSRRHATLERQENPNGTYAYKIIDGDPNGKRSANGILINGNKVTEHILKDQDVIVFGPQVKVVYYLLESKSVISAPVDEEFDITLISPNMVGEGEEF